MSYKDEPHSSWDDRMAGKRASMREFCTSVLNLPDEMQEVLDRFGGLSGLRRNVPDRESLVQDSALFHVLSDPIRLQIMHALKVSDLCPCLLTEITGLSNSKLSYHLSILEQAQLVTSSPKKRWRIYMLTKAGRSWIED